MEKELTIKAVGDIAFPGRLTDQPMDSALAAVQAHLKEADLVIANLESPLVQNGRSTPGKCCLRGHPGWASVLKKAGIDIVSLANNHLMDFGPEGMRQTISALDEAGIYYLGAGNNESIALAPLFLEKNGRRIALLARSGVVVSSPCYASPGRPGVAFLDEEETLDNIRRCRKEADFVILLLHWGMEHYHYPSPLQRNQAKLFIQAGVDLLLGHHPHVLQGMERFGNSLVSYSLGNFLFDTVDWICELPEESPKNITLPLSEKNRQGIILECTVTGYDDLQNTAEFTRINSNAQVVFDDIMRRTQDFNSLGKKFESLFYNCWWPLYAIRQEWTLRLDHRIAPAGFISKIGKLRPEHILQLKTFLKKTIKIATGKSTNPYE